MLMVLIIDLVLFVVIYQHGNMVATHIIMLMIHCKNKQFFFKFAKKTLVDLKSM